MGIAACLPACSAPGDLHQLCTGGISRACHFFAAPRDIDDRALTELPALEPV